MGGGREANGRPLWPGDPEAGTESGSGNPRANAENSDANGASYTNGTNGVALRVRGPDGDRVNGDAAPGCGCSGKRPRLQRRYIFAIGVLLVAAAGLVIVQLVYHASAAAAAASQGGAKPTRREPPDPEEPLPPSASVEHRFARGAVCSDGAPCSAVGRDILLLNGSVVDAAVATLLCNGVVNCQSMGLGGGFLMTLFLQEENKIITLNARETAPAKASPDMFHGDKTKAGYGPLAAGVPGELKGYWEAHKLYGRLPWKDVVSPAAEICEEGYNMTLHQSDSVTWYKDKLKKDDTLRSIFFDSSGSPLHAGNLVKHGKLCETLRIIAERGGDDLYTGELGRMFAEDVQKMGGYITEEDLRSYRVEWLEPVSATLSSGDTVFSVPPPGSGVLLTFMLQLLDGYHFSDRSVATINDTIVTYHRIVEAFKYAFARRTKLGDPKFVDISEVLEQMNSTEYIDKLRHGISDNSTKLDSKAYGAVSVSQDDHGTAHISILGPNGDAISITSSVNLYFGASVASEQTGIILSSVMDDFSNEEFSNYFDLPWSPANSIAPGKRPLSSMSPSIVLDRNGKVRLVIGASGGTKIPTAVALVIMRHVWFGESVKQAVDASRFHHQLFPMEIAYEYGVLNPILRGLEKMGHKVNRYRGRGSIICAVAKQNGSVIANADYRKGGEVFGVD